MIKIKPIKDVPARLIPRLTPYSREEWERAGYNRKLVIETADGLWLVKANGKPLFIAGINRRTLLGKPEFWLLLFSGYDKNLRGNLRETARLTRELLTRYPAITAKVRKDFPAAQRFAEFFGFNRTGEGEYGNGINYITYEANYGA